MVITYLRQDIESCRNQTRVAIESIWKEVEWLWLERAESVDRIEGLERDMEDLQKYIEDLNDARVGGVSIASVGRGQGQVHCLQGGLHRLRSRSQGRIH